MKFIKNKILGFLAKNEDKDVSTSQIVEFIYCDEVKKINEILKNEFSNSKKIKEAKKELANYHKKILYYLNELVKEKKIIITKKGLKNQKYFSINKANQPQENNVGLIRNKVLPIEGYLEKTIITKHKPRFWFECVDSIIIDASKFISLQEMLKFIIELFYKIKDVIAINNFETILLTSKLEDVEKTIYKLIKETNDFDRKISLIFDVSNFHPSYNYKKYILRIIEILSKNKDSKKISVVFDFDKQELKKEKEFFEELFETIKENGYCAYFKNSDVWKPIYYLGGTVPYTINLKDWEIYKSKLFGSNKYFVASQSTLYLDINKFKKEYGENNFSEFRRMINKMLISFLYTNIYQKELFKEEQKNNEILSSNVFPFIISKHYIRFNNFLWGKNNEEKTNKGKEIEFTLDLLKSIKKEIENFCRNEETIYLSCGMPIRFKVEMSIGSEEFIGKKEKDYFNEIKISNFKELYDSNIQEKINLMENLFRIFEGGNVLIIKRFGNPKSNELVNELNFLFNTYSIPIIKYDFSHKTNGFKKLTEFIT